ncbi:superinfection immunity protein [Mesorhizobium sp. PUT5]|uniref:superinfection immunity protein n=1 Tax=Mesorhizobium sp. PUT5 TaxID=3454629 RepID=UPI003FA41CDC
MLVSLAVLTPAAAQDDDVVATVLGFLLVLVILGVVYFLPTIIAFHRQHPNRWVILILNVVLGGTIIVWLGCLVWAFKAVHLTDDPSGSHGGESGLNIVANDVKRVRLEALPPPLPPPPDNTDLIGRLERLKRLLDDGAIDAAQFRRMRNKIIGEEGEGA